MKSGCYANKHPDDVLSHTSTPAYHNQSVGAKTRMAFLHNLKLWLFPPPTPMTDPERTQGLETENRRLKHGIEGLHNQTEALVAARAQQLKTALSDLEKSYDATPASLGEALDAKGGASDNHSKRVTAYTIAMAKQMGLPKEEINVIARGAFLHDIGKMAIPDEILRKPDKLRDDEMALMREHAYSGYKILSKVPFLAEAAEIVYAHHERYDGTGYPRGLQGDEIPLGARVVAIANTLDSITSDLPYRAAQSFSAAREEIKSWSGRQFDPRIVSVFLALPANIWEDLRKDIRQKV